jgi:hypothetical protein|tara:strand:+ start:2757 stop:3878 length:1122 start_codon:yes stop_codon:yes gene_type:complete
MAEQAQELSNAEMHNETLNVLQAEMDSIIEENNEGEVLDVEAESEPEPESVEEPKADTDTPTYKEAEAAQEDTRSRDASPEESEETVSAGEGAKERADLDPEDAEVYGNLKPKAQERFEHWINRAKELETQTASLEPSRNLHKYITDSGTNSDQLQWAVETFRNLNSGNYEQAQQALKSLDKFADQIGEALGVNKTENDASSYNDFEDLKGAVENLEISEEWASKLAEQRTSSQSQDQAKETFTQAHTQQMQAQQNLNHGKEQAYNDIDQWEKSLASNDADYNSTKKEIMMEIGRELASSNIPPQNWLPNLQQQYNVLTRGMSVAATGNSKASKNSGPLAPTRTSGGSGNPLELEKAEVTPEFLQAHLDAMRS